MTIDCCRTGIRYLTWRLTTFLNPRWQQGAAIALASVFFRIIIIPALGSLGPSDRFIALFSAACLLIYGDVQLTCQSQLLLTWDPTMTDPIRLNST